MGADLGLTNIYSPLLDIFNQSLNKGYPKQIFMLTDGAVDDNNEVLKLI